MARSRRVWIPWLVTALTGGALFAAREKKEPLILDQAGHPVVLETTKGTTVYDAPGEFKGVELLKHQVGLLPVNVEVLLLGTSADGLYQKVAFYGGKPLPQLEGWVVANDLRKVA